MSWREFSTIYFTGALLPNTKYIFSYNFEIFNVYITYRISGMNEQIKRNDINNLIFRESIIAVNKFDRNLDRSNEIKSTRKI